MGGEICGLDMAQALASIASDLDPDFARALFAAAEIAFVAALLKNKG